MPKTLKQVAWLCGLVTFVCTAILGQAELVGEPWRHWLSIVSIIGTALTGYMMQPTTAWDGQERRDDVNN